MNRLIRILFEISVRKARDQRLHEERTMEFLRNNGSFPSSFRYLMHSCARDENYDTFDDVNVENQNFGPIVRPRYGHCQEPSQSQSEDKEGENISRESTEDLDGN